MNKFNQQVLNEENNNNKRKSRHHVVVSDKNHLMLKKLGYTLESDSMDQTISKILAKIPGVYEINVTESQ